MVPENETVTTNEAPKAEAPVKKGPFGRPLKSKPEEAAPAPATERKPSMRERLIAATVARGHRTMMSPAELRTRMEKRQDEIVAALEAYNKGVTARPKAYIEQLRFEAKLIAAGTWTPGVKRPKGANRETLEAIMGVPGMVATPQAQAKEDRVDAMLQG